MRWSKHTVGVETARDGALADSDQPSSEAAPPGSSDAAQGESGADAVAPGDASSTPPPGAGLHVSGNQILDGNGKSVHLLGVTRSGTEYSCVHGTGIFDGPSDAASISAMVGWKINAVRVPLNEDCWLGINGIAAEYSGATYQTAISDYVNLLLAAGIHPILELHWNAPGTTQATGQEPMPDSDHAVAFWTDVATHFKDSADVVLELYNEPYPDNNQDTTAAWTCWRDGGSCPSVPFPVAGMQTLVTAVRAAGATNLVLLGGVQYSNALSQWLKYEPTDPENNLAASWHVYDNNVCNSTSCYDTTAGPVAASAPIVATEIGESDCSGAFITTLMGWLDGKSQSYLGFAWDTWGTCLMLISDYTGTANGVYGQTFKTHLGTATH